MTGDPSNDESGFKFPCEYAIKAMGLAEPGFEATVIEIVRPHAPDLDVESIRTKPSRNGRFLSVTILIEAVSRDQLDAIYDDLTAHEKILMRL